MVYFNSYKILCKMYATFNWDIFFTLLKKKLIIPVIGSDLVLHKTGKDISLKLTEHIANQLAKNLKLELNNLSLQQFILKYQNSTMVKSMIKHIFNDIKIENIDFEPLRKLAEITDFDTFISLNFDGFLEQTLQSVRTQENIKVINMSPATEINAVAKSINQTSVYNIFGNIHSANYAKTESEYLEYIVALNNSNNLNNQLLRAQTQGKSFLFLGNDLSDWLNGFLIRYISNEPFDNAENVKFIAENERDSNSSYARFAQNIPMEYYRSQNNYKSNSLSFIDELYEKWRQYNSRQNSNFYQKSVFINACSENLDELNQLNEVLQNKGIDIYYNRSLHSNPSVFTKESENQIKRCTLFISLISDKSLSAPKDAAYFREIKIAQMRHEWFHDTAEDSFIEAYYVGENEKNKLNIPKFLKTFELKDFDTAKIKDNVLKKLNKL
jgi:hypothetical protein